MVNFTMTFKSLQMTVLDKVREKNTRTAIIATVGLFLFIALAYRAALTNTSRRQSYRGQPLSGNDNQQSKAINTLCETWSDIKLVDTPSNTNRTPVKTTTTAGILEGQTKELFGEKYNYFLGVPYAQPPLAELRFKKTVPVKPWTGVRPANQYRSHCSQYFFKALLETVHPLHYDMSEDCLYLNVWTPAKKSEQLRPVMVFIHGGGIVCFD